MIRRLLALLSIAAFAPAAWAADALTGEVHKQPLKVSAIVMFVVFVGATLCIVAEVFKSNFSFFLTSPWRGGLFDIEG